MLKFGCCICLNGLTPSPAQINLFFFFQKMVDEVELQIAVIFRHDFFLTRSRSHRFLWRSPPKLGTICCLVIFEHQQKMVCQNLLSWCCSGWRWSPESSRSSAIDTQKALWWLWQVENNSRIRWLLGSPRWPKNISKNGHMVRKSCGKQQVFSRDSSLVDFHKTTANTWGSRFRDEQWEKDANCLADWRENHRSRWPKILHILIRFVRSMIHVLAPQKPRFPWTYWTKREWIIDHKLTINCYCNSFLIY